MKLSSLPAAVLACGLLVSTPVFADPVDVLFEEGVAAAQAGQREVAYEKLKAAWALRQTYDIAANLAVVENSLGKHRDAAEHFQFALQNFPPISEPEKRALLEKGLAAARAKVGELKINVAPGAEVEVNGRAVGVSPLKAPVFVDPGQATVTCKKKDFGEGQALVEVKIGEAKDVTVEIKITTGTEKPKEAPIPIWPGLLVGGVGLAGVGVGIGLAIEANSAAGEARDLRDGLPAQNSCLGSSPPDVCGTIQNNFEAHDSLGTGSIVAFAVGGALLATGVALFAVGMSGDQPKSDEKAAVTAMTPWFTSDAGGFVVRGSF